MSDHSQKKYFTVEEANAILRKILPFVERLAGTVEDVQELAEEVRPMFENAELNGGHPTGSLFVLEFQRLQKDIEAIQSHGCVIKDPSIGLLDFPSMRDDREVELCWRLGEDEIRYWHEVNAGYQGRQPI